MTSIRQGIATAVIAGAAVTGATGTAAPAAAAPTAAAVAVAVAGATSIGAPATVMPKASHKSLDKRCRTGRVVCVDKTARKVRWVVDGKVKLELSARFGSSRTPTRSGSYRIYWKDIDHVSSLFGSAMPFSMFFNGGQAVHYSADFAARGYNGASHGCVNTRNYARMKQLYKAARVGDKVVIYRG